MKCFIIKYPFLMSQNFEKQGCYCYGDKQIKYSFADKENSEKSFEATLYYLQWFS